MCWIKQHSENGATANCLQDDKAPLTCEARHASWERNPGERDEMRKHRLIGYDTKQQTSNHPWIASGVLPVTTIVELNFVTWLRSWGQQRSTCCDGCWEKCWRANTTKHKRPLIIKRCVKTQSFSYIFPTSGRQSIQFHEKKKLGWSQSSGIGEYYQLQRIFTSKVCMNTKVVGG